MKCLYCGQDDTRVIDSRTSDDGLSIRRRRVCESCGKRFTTYEKIESVPLFVIKKDGSRQAFNRQKLIERILRACQKRAVSMADINALADEIESAILNTPHRELSTKDIGDRVLRGLWRIDEVAYVRFASIYQEFDSLETFINAIKEIKKQRRSKG
ncbi:MAG: transcriptional repressor NrdR [Lachnospiraceae bacterium]|nr:transcriptional repressor NrdR [Lachnospiraceae bacterium]